MSKKPGPSYDSVTIAPKPMPAPAQAVVPATVQIALAPAKKLMRDDAAPMTVYIHPDARKALKRYALEQEVKVHDLALEAIEDWFRAHGIDVTVRVQSEEARKR